MKSVESYEDYCINSVQLSRLFIFFISCTVDCMQSSNFKVDYLRLAYDFMLSF